MTAEEKFFSDWPTCPISGDEWDKYDKEAQMFDSYTVIDFADRFLTDYKASLREAVEKEALRQIDPKYGENQISVFTLDQILTLIDSCEPKQQKP